MNRPSTRRFPMLESLEPRLALSVAPVPVVHAAISSHNPYEDGSPTQPINTQTGNYGSGNGQQSPSQPVDPITGQPLGNPSNPGSPTNPSNPVTGHPINVGATPGQTVTTPINPVGATPFFGAVDSVMAGETTAFLATFPHARVARHFQHGRHSETYTVRETFGRNVLVFRQTETFGRNAAHPIAFSTQLVESNPHHSLSLTVSETVANHALHMRLRLH